MPSPKLDFSRLSSFKVGKGASGTKTTQLDRYKAILENHGLIIPPHVSLSEEFCIAPLIRVEWMDEERKPAGKPRGEIAFSDEERRTLRDAISQFQDFILAVRSDEQTAKGIGLFKTEFVDMREDYFERFLSALVSVLEAQFNPDANAFKERTGMPHGIGVQLMPLAAMLDKRIDRVFPLLSLAGFTAREHDEVILHLGFGIGGGVSTKTIHRKLACTMACPDWITVQRGFFTQIGGESFNPSTSSFTWAGPSFVWDYDDLSFYGKANNAIDALLGKLRAIAIEAGDLYFEAQLIDKEEKQWAITQISEHHWPKVDRPIGKQILEINGYGNVVGSGIASCNDCTGRQDAKRGSLVAFHSGSLSDNFSDFAFSSGILENIDDHIRDISSHVSGAYREAGIIVLGCRKYLHNKIPERLKGERFLVWGDELGGQGGIVIP
jgi:hypothetical protein